jgi:o-succinylbenzoate---CoA ligase
MKNLSPDSFLLHKEDPTSKAIVTSAFTYTFDDFRQKVLSTAGYLKKQNISSGDRVGIIGQNDFDFVINILALWQLSAVPVPINIRLTEFEMEEQFAAARCSAVLSQKEFSGRIKDTGRKIIKYPFEIEVDSTFTGSQEIKVNDSAVIIFTSGSSSKSKGIILTFNNLYNSAINSNQLLRYTQSDRWLASLPFYHIGGIFDYNQITTVWHSTNHSRFTFH